MSPKILADFESTENDRSYTGHGKSEDPLKRARKDRESLERLLRIYRPWEENYPINEIFVDKESNCSDIYEEIIADQRGTDKHTSYEELEVHSNELATCGLSCTQLEFLFSNSKKHDFSVNIITVFANRIFLVQMGIAKRNGHFPAKCITLFKVKVKYDMERLFKIFHCCFESPT